MAKHFEELWEESESLFKNDSGSVSTIITELQAKLSLYVAIENQENIPVEEKQKLKSHTFGKILTSLTQLSLKDNVNTFSALTKAVEDLKIEILEAKYKY